MAQTFARDGSPVRLSLITTEGAAESIALFTAGKADLAVARGDLNLPAERPSRSPSCARMSSCCGRLSGLPAKGSKKPPAPKIKSLDELAGHRVGVIGRTAGQCHAAARDPDRSPASIPTRSRSASSPPTRSPKWRAIQTIDAFMAVGPLNSKITVDAIAATAAARGEPKFLPIDVSEAIAKKHPLYEVRGNSRQHLQLLAGAPRGQVDTVSVNHLIIAPKSLSDTAVGAFARQLFTVRQQLARELPTASQIEKPDTDKDAALPAHAGAAAYIDGNERTFLEKYTDYIWGAILVLSGLGSAGAWLRHYWKRDEREQYIAHRDHLLDLISKVRQAETPEELAEMQGAADGMLRETLDCYDDGAIEEGDLSVIGLALEQFHHAVADRRSPSARRPRAGADARGCSRRRSMPPHAGHGRSCPSAQPLV